MVPTCEILHTTAPSVWLSSSLTSMSSSAFSNCLELMGHDPFLASYQRTEVLRRVKQVRLIVNLSQSNKNLLHVFHLMITKVFRSSYCLCSVFAPGLSVLMLIHEDIWPSLLLLPGCHLSARCNSDTAIIRRAECHSTDWAEKHCRSGHSQWLE